MSGKAGALLRRLCRMSVDEYRVRGSQVLCRYAERVLGYGQGEYDDRAFRKRLRRDWRSEAPETVVRRLRQRVSAAPLMPGAADRAGIVRVMNERFEAEAAAVVARANRAVHGRFDLLGWRDLWFGDPIDWRLEPVSGKRTSLDHWSRIAYLDREIAGDKKIVWELNRHAHLVTLGQAYWLTGNERYADTFVAHVTQWLEANPPRRGINWASSLEVSFRAIAWLWALHFFAASERMTTSFVWRLLKGLAQHGDYLRCYLSHYFSPNTHLTGEALGLLYLGTTLDECASAALWRDLGRRILLDQLPKQVRMDGVYFEQAAYYHRYTVDFYLHLIMRARAAGMPLPSWVDHTVGAMLDHLMWITRPDGAATLYGDDDGGRLVSLGVRDPDDFRDTLAWGALLYGRSDWKWVAGTVPAELLWLAGPEAVDTYDAIECRRPADHMRLFERSGYAVLRDGWGGRAAYLFFDSGPHGALRSGHAHDDALSVEYAADGVAWIVDPGTYTYTGDAAARDRFRSTGGHNTVAVDGVSHSIPDGPFSWTTITDARVVGCRWEAGSPVIEGTHDGYRRLERPVCHRRTVTLGSRRDRAHAASPALITDVVSADSRHRYELRFHLGPGCEATTDQEWVRVTHVSGRQLAVATWRLLGDGVVPLPLHFQQGWVSRCYGQRQETRILSARLEADGPQTMLTVLLPIEAGETVLWEQWLAMHALPVDLRVPACCGSS